MVFMGKGRGRGGQQHSGGVLSATTRREKRPDEYTRNDRSRSPVSKRPAMERLGPQRDDASPSRESLRITVGNEIYKDRHSRSPLSDRLGPPVKRNESYDEMKYHSDARYDELYGGDGERQRRRDRYDSPRNRRSDSYDREWKSSYNRDRDRRSSSRDRDRDRRDRDGGRHGSYDRYSDRDKKEYRSDKDRHEDRGRNDSYDDSKRHHSDRSSYDKDRSSFGRDQYSPPRYRIPDTYPVSYTSSTPFGAVPVQPGSVEPKPLKSILKKSAPEPPVASRAAAPATAQSSIPSDPYGHEQVKRPSQKSLSSLPGMSSYMDIEDEERFLYGEDDEKNRKEIKKRELLEYRKEDRPHQASSYPGGYPPVDVRYPPQYGQSAEYLDRGQQPQQRKESDLLSMFSSQRGPTTPIQTTPYPPAPQPSTSPTDKKAKYDPTIENILKSIGFDFEMSKRMQEKAHPTPPKPKEDIHQYGIDQASSFLGGEFTDDMKKEIFPSKSRQESMVDVLLREAKLTSPTSDKPKTLPVRDSSRERRDSHPSSDRSYSRDLYEDKSRSSVSTASQPPYSVPLRSVAPTSSQPPYSAPSTSYPTSTAPTSYEATTTSATPYPSTTPYAVSGFSSYAPPPTAYTTPPPFGMPPLPGHPPMWAAPPGLPRFMPPRPPFGAPYGYPPGYPPYGTPPPLSTTTTGSTMVKDSSSVTTIAKPNYQKKQSNLKTVELTGTKKLDEPASKKSETKTITVVKKVKKVEKGKPKSSGSSIVSSTTSSSNRTVLPPKTKTVVKKTSEKQSPKPSPKRSDREQIVITKVILTAKEKEKVQKEKEQNIQRMKILEQELSSLRKQQNELMRKRRRQKDGHKDPILMQNSKLQDEITKQISKLKQETDEKSKILKDASIDDSDLSSTPKRSQESSSSRRSPPVSESPAKKPRTDSRYDRSRSSDSRSSDPKLRDKPKQVVPKRKESTPSTDKQKQDERHSSGTTKQSDGKGKDMKEVIKDFKESQEKIKEKDTFKPLPVKKVKYEFFDPGNHWCRVCNIVCSNLTNMLQHLHGKKHQNLMNKYDRPWLPDELRSDKPTKDKAANKDDMKVEVSPIKGQEFFMATKGYFCNLCKEHCGDDMSAEYHIKSDGHYLKYQDYIKDNPFYEQRLNLDKAAGISLVKEEEQKKEKLAPTKLEPKQEKAPVKQEEKDLTIEAKKLEQKKKIQAIWDQHIKTKHEDKGPSQNKKEQSQPEEEKEKGDKEKAKIQINILNKGSIKTKQEPLVQKKTVLPPWNPVTKEQKAQPAKVSETKRPSLEDEEPAALEDFITVGDNKKIPLVSDPKKVVTAEHLIEKVMAKKNKETENKEVTLNKEEAGETDKPANKTTKMEVSEEKNDLEILGIDPSETKPVGEVIPPPPPSQNLSLPTEKKQTDKMATSSSDEMYTLYFSDDKKVEKSTPEGKADDLVEIDADANVTYVSDEEDEPKKAVVIVDEAKPVPLQQAKESDLVVISLDSQSEGSVDEEVIVMQVGDDTTETRKGQSEIKENVTNSTESTDNVLKASTDVQMDGKPIEVIGTTKKAEETVETESTTAIEVVQSRRTEQQTPQKITPTFHIRNLSNLHELNAESKEKEKLTKGTKIKKVTSPTKKRSYRKQSVEGKIDRKITDKSLNRSTSNKSGKKDKKSERKSTESKSQKNIQKKRLSDDVVSISDEEGPEYENVDSDSDFPDDDPQLENISSSSEKFTSDIQELENVSSDSEIENDKDDLENISSDEMEGNNVMLVDEVGEVDDFVDFDFHDMANVVDQVGESDEEMEVDRKKENKNVGKINDSDLEVISDGEDAEFRKNGDEVAHGDKGDGSKASGGEKLPDTITDTNITNENEPGKQEKDMLGKSMENLNEECLETDKPKVENDTSKDEPKTNAIEMEEEIKHARVRKRGRGRGRGRGRSRGRGKASVKVVDPEESLDIEKEVSFVDQQIESDKGAAEQKEQSSETTDSEATPKRSLRRGRSAAKQVTEPEIDEGKLKTDAIGKVQTSNVETIMNVYETESSAMVSSETKEVDITLSMREKVQNSEANSAEEVSDPSAELLDSKKEIPEVKATEEISDLSVVSSEESIKESDMRDVSVGKVVESEPIIVDISLEKNVQEGGIDNDNSSAILQKVKNEKSENTDLINDLESGQPISKIQPESTIPDSVPAQNDNEQFMTDDNAENVAGIGYIAQSATEDIPEVGEMIQNDNNKYITVLENHENDSDQSKGKKQESETIDHDPMETEISTTEVSKEEESEHLDPADTTIVSESDTNDTLSNTLCQEINTDSIETPSSKSELSVPIAQSNESNKNSNISEFIHLDFGNIDPIVPAKILDDSNRDSDNTSCTSEIKIDIVLEAIDSLAQVDTGGNILNKPEEPSAIQTPTTGIENIVVSTPTIEMEKIAVSSPTIEIEKIAVSTPTTIIEKVAVSTPTTVLEKVAISTPVGQMEVKDSSESVDISLNVRTDESLGADDTDKDLSLMSSQLGGNETDADVIDFDNEDAMSEGSGISMDMGSDFEVVDECDSDQENIS